ncbi:efflux transporter outer membrane subunit [Bartonella taylorii]|uniref:Efflux transporter outer membrane subunit n=2 Tax=Bartonella taylorii TaxID=33046 RepID=A0A9Q9DLI9_BARTA|nr:efflux transporter outer membrane subunit [Bartonella taylorii]EJF97703.1 NodT family efflux transporter, outer membrane factor (OMF) lipoprotein [Bartonella taylorii 8TBB]OPB35220.1 efflux transporter, outer membrane factor (OMF) lipoprotein, NodT family [Bartonella taylorii]USP01199.1 efflux transporter outer membrane subunit [Bartonella taylorii]USP02365.1 efflux transporter outer membrane subunit [Bartonella taylorii]
MHISKWVVSNRLLYSVLLCFFILSGCMVGPNYHKTTFRVPAVWGEQSAQTSGRADVLAGWWRRLNDPVLNALMNYAISGNNSVAVAKARVREARAGLGQAVGSLLPSVSNSISGTRSSSEQSDAFFSQYRSGFDASWELDFFGGRKRAVEAARYGLDAAVEDMRATMVTLLGDVATNYVQVRGWQQKLLIVRQIALSQRKTYELMRAKLKAGDISELDVSNAQAQMANTEADISQMEANLAMSIHRLSVLTGHVPMALKDLLQKNAKHAKIPQPKWPIPAGIPADILLTRPDLRRAERQYAQATARIGQREADRYPSLSLTGNISTVATAIDQLWKNSTIGWSFGPGLRFPFFNGGQVVASVAVARAQRDQAFITYRAAVLGALEDVENALVRLTKEHQRLEKLIVANKASLHSLKLSRSLFENGNISFLELLNANRSYYSSQMALKDSRVSLVTQYITLMKALGGGWDGVVDVSRSEVVDGAPRSHTRVGQ